MCDRSDAIPFPGTSRNLSWAAELLESEDNETVLKDLGMAKMLRCRIRYFTDGAVIGSSDYQAMVSPSGLAVDLE